MLPFNNKNEFLLVLDLNKGTSLERTSAVVTECEQVLATVPEVTDFISYVGVPGPIDFNGLVRHYYLRQSPNLAEIRINLVGKKQRRQQSHAINMRLRDQLTALADKHSETGPSRRTSPGAASAGLGCRRSLRSAGSSLPGPDDRAIKSSDILGKSVSFYVQKPDGQNVGLTAL